MKSRRSQSMKKIFQTLQLYNVCQQSRRLHPGKHDVQINNICVIFILFCVTFEKHNFKKNEIKPFFENSKMGFGQHIT